MKRSTGQVTHSQTAPTSRTEGSHQFVSHWFAMEGFSQTLEVAGEGGAGKNWSNWDWGQLPLGFNCSWRNLHPNLYPYWADLSTSLPHSRESERAEEDFGDGNLSHELVAAKSFLSHSPSSRLGAVVTKSHQQQGLGRDFPAGILGGTKALGEAQEGTGLSWNWNWCTLTGAISSVHSP